jgi:hypothetical protein
VRTEPAIEVCIDPLQVESLEKAVEVGHRGELARDSWEPFCRMCSSWHLDTYTL